MKVHANPKRSFAKTITWRICATLTTMLLVWIFYRDLSVAFQIGLIEVVIKMIVYYGHERLWSRVRWGLISYD